VSKIIQDAAMKQGMSGMNQQPQQQQQQPGPQAMPMPMNQGLPPQSFAGSSPFMAPWWKGRANG
jgi:hypothetical protein